MEELLNKKIAEVETCLTYDVYKDFYCFSLSKSRKYKEVTKLIYRLGLVGILISVWCLLISSNKTIHVNLIIIDVLLIASRIITSTYLPKKSYEKNEKLLKNPIKYTFFEDYLLVENSNDPVKGTLEVKYESLYKAYELDDVIYMFFERFQGYITIKNQISKESLDRIREILDSKLGYKYYKYY